MADTSFISSPFMPTVGQNVAAEENLRRLHNNYGKDVDMIAAGQKAASGDYAGAQSSLLGQGHFEEAAQLQKYTSVMQDRQLADLKRTYELAGNAARFAQKPEQYAKLMDALKSHGLDVKRFEDFETGRPLALAYSNNVTNYLNDEMMRRQANKPETIKMSGGMDRFSRKLQDKEYVRLNDGTYQPLQEWLEKNMADTPTHQYWRGGEPTKTEFVGEVGDIPTNQVQTQMPEFGSMSVQPQQSEALQPSQPVMGQQSVARGAKQDVLTPEKIAASPSGGQQMQTTAGNQPQKAPIPSKPLPDGVVVGPAAPKEYIPAGYTHKLADDGIGFQWRETPQGLMPLFIPEATLKADAENKQTKGQEAVDREFGKEYAKFVSGGAAVIEKNINQLAYVKKLIDDPNTTMSGTIVGNQPDWMLAITQNGRKAIDTRELAQEVIQSSLREILGAQFTAKEGEAFMARVFNPRLGEPENKRRIANLTQRIIQAASDKVAAAKHFEENGTLRGFKMRPVVTVRDLENSITSPQETSRTAHPPRPDGIDEDTIRAQAQAAIAAGKDPKEVAARLKAWGVSE